MTGSHGDRNTPARSGRNVLLALLPPALAIWSAGCTTEGITVVSWGGSYEEACSKALFEPFSAETGIEVLVEDTAVRLEDL